MFGGTWALPGSPYGTFFGGNTTHNIPGLVAGTYHIIVSGFVSGTDTQGSYGVALVSAVPEPETYAMMLLGVGVLGFVARLRKQIG